MKNCVKCKHAIKDRQFGFYFCQKKNIILKKLNSDCSFFAGRNKYNNVKITVGGITYDSKKESKRLPELQYLEKNGEIKNLQRQVRFLIIPKTKDERAAYYVADYVYERADGKKVIEDVKSPATRKDKTYILKRKLVKLNYPDYVFIET